MSYRVAKWHKIMGFTDNTKRRVGGSGGQAGEPCFQFGNKFLPRRQAAEKGWVGGLHIKTDQQAAEQAVRYQGGLR